VGGRNAGREKSSCDEGRKNAGLYNVAVLMVGRMLGRTSVAVKWVGGMLGGKRVFLMRVIRMLGGTMLLCRW